MFQPVLMRVIVMLMTVVVMRVVVVRMMMIVPFSALNEVFFPEGDVAGFVDSWPEILVPSASNRSTPEWTPVDSRQGRFDESQLRARPP